MAIPSVVQGLIETEGGKVFELDSPKGTAWVEALGSFRFEPVGDSKPCTVRREPSGYWYGCRKVAGKVRKKYIGKTSKINTAKLEEVAAALEVSPVPRVSKVAEVAQDRLTALELEVASLRKALEALQEALPRKLELGDSAELHKVDIEVVEQLQNELSNLKTENEYLRQKLAESRGTVETLNWGTGALNEQLEAAQSENQRLQNDLGNSQAEVTELRSQLESEKTRYKELEEEFWDMEQVRTELRVQLTDREKQIEELRSELSDLKQKSVAASKDLPEAANILKDLRKALGKKSTASLADVEKILEIIEGDDNE